MLRKKCTPLQMRASSEMETKSGSPANLADYLLERRVDRIIDVVRVLTRTGSFRGKHNLGKAAGAIGHCYPTQPVERAEKLGLVAGKPQGDAYIYRITALGQAVIAKIDRRDDTP